MSPKNPRDRRTQGLSAWLPMWVLAAAVGVLVLLSAVLAVQAGAELRGLREQRGDNVLWNVAQLELEHNALQLAIVEARGSADPADASAVTNAFNIYYSRLTLMLEGGSYRSTMEAVDALPVIALLREEARALLPLIDGPPEDLLAALDDTVLATIAPHRIILREISSDVTVSVAERDEASRLQLLELMQSLALLPLLLFLLLVLLAAVIYRLFSALGRRSDQVRRMVGRLQTIITTSRDGIIVTDGDGAITDINEAAAALFDVAPDDVLDAPITRLIPDAPADLSQAAARVTGHRSDGDAVPLEMTIGADEDRDGMVRVYILRDIRHRLAIEQDLRDSRDRALAGERAKARFLAVMSHEMRTPLNGILGTISLLRAANRDPEVQRYIGIMEGSGEMLLGHINDVLDISRLETSGEGVTLTLAPVDLDRLSADLLEGLAPLGDLRGIRMRRVTGFPGGSVILADRLRLRRILLNLLDNALKNTDSGEVTLDVSLSSSGDTPTLEIQVTDTGRGIPAEETSRIFDDYVRLGSDHERQVEGSGLGLGITRRLVEAMSGQIGVESEPGHGSLFWVRIPARRAVLSEADAPSAPRVGQALDVLVVEDNAVNRLILREMLLHDGHRVVEAENGAEGVAQADKQRFDLVLMDLSMPVMDGLAATREIRNGQGPNAKSRIVALTAHVYASGDTACRDAGMDAVITKPLTWPGLRSLLAGLSDQGAPEVAPDLVRRPPPGLDPEPLPLLDAAVFSALVSVMSVPDLAPHLARFRQDGKALLARLGSGEAVDPAEVHALAGAAAMLGARRLHRSLASQESTGAEGHEAPDLRQLWDSTLKALDLAVMAADESVSPRQPD